MEGSAAPALTHSYLFFKSLVLISQLGPIGDVRGQLSSSQWYPYKYSAFLQPFFWLLVVSTAQFSALLTTFSCPLHLTQCWLPCLFLVCVDICSSCWAVLSVPWRNRMDTTPGLPWSLRATTRHKVPAVAALKSQHQEYTNVNHSSGGTGLENNRLKVYVNPFEPGVVFKISR